MGIFATVPLPWMMTAHYNHRPPAVQQQNKEKEQKGNQIRLNLTDFWIKMNKKLVQKSNAEKNLKQGEHF